MRCLSSPTESTLNSQWMQLPESLLRQLVRVSVSEVFPFFRRFIYSVCYLFCLLFILLKYFLLVSNLIVIFISDRVFILIKT